MVASRLLVLTLPFSTISFVAIAQSDPANFTTVIDTPPTILGDDVTIGSDTQVNLFDAGSLGNNIMLGPGTNVELNIYGGSLGTDLKVNTGSVVNFTGGVWGSSSGSQDFAPFIVAGTNGTLFPDTIRLGGGELNFKGGLYVSFFNLTDGTGINISGGVFAPGSMLSGTQLVGGEFRVNGVDYGGANIMLDSDDVFTGTLSDGSPMILVRAVGESGGGFGQSNEVITFVEGRLSRVPLPTISTTSIIVDGSNPGSQIYGLRSGETLELRAGGVLGPLFNIIDGARLSIEGGFISGIAQVAYAQADISSGGADSLIAYSGGTLNLSGGFVNELEALQGSVINILGGEITSELDTRAGSTVNISGGSVEFGFQAVNQGAQVNISGGTVDNGFRAEPGSTVNVSGGTIGSEVLADAGSMINISGGMVRRIETEGFVNISGGMIGTRFQAERDSVINISGGEFDGDFRASSGSEVHIFGQEFYLDDVPVLLAEGETITITERDDAELSGLFNDGTSFSFILDASSFGGDEFELGA